MERERYTRLVEIMALLAGGDEAAVVMLYTDFGADLAAVVRGHLRHFNVAYVPPDDLNDLVIEAAFTVADCAAGWDASRGVLPWTWAAQRIRHAVSREIGQFADELDEASLREAAAPGPATTSEPAELELLIGLAEGDEVCRLLLAAFEEVTSPRDRDLVLAYKLQHALGDPSPAHTVAAGFAMQPAAVRKAVSRALGRLRTLAATDARYAPLADLALLAA